MLLLWGFYGTADIANGARAYYVTDSKQRSFRDPVPTIIHIVDDDAQVRAGTSYLLASHGYSTQVYARGEEFLSQARIGKGCVLLDLRMPGLSGLDVLADLAERGVEMPVIMMSGHGELAEAIRAMKAGAIDFFEKPYKEHELIAAIERALDLDLTLRRRGGDKHAACARVRRLSPRERQILQGLLGGMTNKAIARHLDLSPRTVEMHRSNMMNDLGITSVPDAVRIAIDAELPPLDEKSVASRKPRQIEATVASTRPREGSPVPELAPELTSILEATTDCAFLLDREWRFTYINANAEATIARGQDLLGQVIWDAFPLVRETRAWQEMHRAANDRQPAQFEFFEPDLECWFNVKVRPTPTGLQVFFRDLTQERKTVAALHLSEGTLRLALEATGDGAWDWDIRTGDVVMSPRLLEKLGYGEKLLPGRFATVQHLVHPEDWPELICRLNSHLTGHSEAFACEYRLRRADGDWFWNFDRGKVVSRDPISGAPLRMVGTACDVTERKAREANAREALERIALAQESAGAGTWDLDLSSGTLHLCSRSLVMHGLSAERSHQLSECEWSETVHPDDRSAVQRKLAEAIEQRTVFRAKYRTVAADGNCRWVWGLGRMAADVTSPGPRFIGLNLDVTEGMVSAQELKRVQSELVHLSRLSAIDSMTSMLAHELNQPLTAISAFVGSIRHSLRQRNGVDTQDLLPAVEGAERSARYASEIIRRLRDHADQSSIEMRCESMSDTIDEAARLCRDLITGLVRLSVNVHPNSDEVLIDRVQIEQVLLNLLRNAHEAASSNGSDAAVVITATPAAEFVEVRVSDGGPGVPDELRGHLFTTMVSSKPHGMGLGLSISRTIVESHGGRIWCEDGELGGACFCFTVPRPRAARD